MGDIKGVLMYITSQTNDNGNIFENPANICKHYYKSRLICSPGNSFRQRKLNTRLNNSRIFLNLNAEGNYTAPKVKIRER